MTNNDAVAKFKTGITCNFSTPQNLIINPSSGLGCQSLLFFAIFDDIGEMHITMPQMLSYYYFIEFYQVFFTPYRIGLRFCTLNYILELPSLCQWEDNYIVLSATASTQLWAWFLAMFKTQSHN